MLAYGKQSIDEADVAAVAAALRSDFLTQGPLIEQFEKRFADCIGARHAVAVSNATAALHLAMHAAGVGVGDRVVTSPITFVASANAAAYVGAIPDFADIDATATLSPSALEQSWREDTKAVVAVDYAGQAADLPGISAVAKARGAIVIEDACHGVGGVFHEEGDSARRRFLGANPWADFGVFSFHPVKTMTTGEGGMLVTNRDDWAEAARLFRTHGILRKRENFVIPDDDTIMGEKGPWYYEMQQLGFNYRLTDFQCALGLSQLSRLDAFLQRRREIVAQYNRQFADLRWLQCPVVRHEADRATASWHLYSVRIDFSGIGKSRTQVMSELRAAGVGTQVLYIPVHLQPWYRRTYGYAPGKCPQAEQFYRQALSLPLYPAMSDDDVARVVNAVRALV